MAAACFRRAESAGSVWGGGGEPVTVVCRTPFVIEGVLRDGMWCTRLSVGILSRTRGAFARMGMGVW